MKHTLILFAFLLTSFVAQAQKYYEFTPLLTDAYQKSISLRFKEAEVAVQQVKEQEPDNMLVYYVENYIDILKVFINEDYKEFERLEANKERRLSKLASGPENSPYHLYTLAEVRLHWAIARAKFEEYRTAMLEVRSAFLKLERNQKKFPDFVANKKSLGILHSLVGTVPKKYQWLVSLAGMSGTIAQGQAEIQEVVDYAQSHPEFVFEEEATIMYALMMLHIGNEESTAWNAIRSSRLDPKTNPLICFAQASVAQHTGRNDEAIKILEQRPKGSEYHPYYFLDYMMGLAKLYKQEQDAGYYLSNFVINHNGRNYIKECYQKLAWFKLLQGDEQGYRDNMQKLLARGKAIIETDKNARKEAKSKQMPNPILLKARLQFDGGYYEAARATLDAVAVSSFTNQKHQIEYHYRKGRILQELHQNEEAVAEYNFTIEKGRNLPEYFACKSALETGIIYEESGNYSRARKYFNTCLSIEPSQYADGIHGKAKAGLNRIQNKL